MAFAEVILPLAIESTLTYSIPPEMASRITVGCRVIVPLGRSKFYTGIVASISPIPPTGYEVKPIALTLDTTPVIRNPQLRIWRWIADYYMCGVGEVYKAAVPAGLKVESETFVELNPDYEETGDSILSEAEAIVCQYLDHEAGRATIEDIGKKTGLKRINAIISALLDRGAIIISERLVERYRARKEVFIRPLLTTQEEIAEAFGKVKGAPKQETALLAILEMSGAGRRSSTDVKEVSRREIMERADVTVPIISSLEKKGLIEVYRKEINRFNYSGNIEPQLPELTTSQSKALNEIHDSWKDHNVTLLHGVTSSGKTEIYIHLMDYVLRQKRQVLYMVPEIALTTQLSHRLQKVFGKKVLIYHSKFSDNERVDIWRKMLELKNEPVIVLGVRSSVFLPFGDVGLVIVDEEHDSSYKQQDPAPRYNGRDAAMLLASMHGAKTLLGSATPSVETFYKAKNGRYGLVSLNERYEERPMPRIDLIDMKAARKRGETPKGRALDNISSRLIDNALENKQQAIIFLNRRGYAPMARCSICGFIPKCRNCDVSLTYHRNIDRLVCHYCGATYSLPSTCPACKEHSIEIVGHGTERIEDEVTERFPDASIARMDLDTTRNKDGYATIIDDFSSRKNNILIGTQMVTKGLDFDGVSVVAVLNADAVLHYPDFRSSERAFNMIEQVAGRAGRATDDSVVTVQTYEPDHPIYGFIKNHDYNGFYDYEIKERELFNYPPFAKVVYIYLKHKDKDALSQIADAYAQQLRALLGNRVFGPEEPSVSRVRSLYVRKIMLKVETTASMQKVKTLLKETRNKMFSYPAMKSTVLFYDVDPV